MHLSTPAAIAIGALLYIALGWATVWLFTGCVPPSEDDALDLGAFRQLPGDAE